MKFMKYLGGVLILLALALLSACSSVTDPAEVYKDETAQQIFQRGEAALRDHNYQEAIKRFEALEVQYPFGHDTEIAQLHLIYAYYMTSDYTLSEAAADRFIHAHAANSYVDYAYFMRGQANYFQNLGVFERLFAVDLATRDLVQIKKSYGDFAQVVKLFPHSRYAPAAHQYMIYLRNILADHELEVAEYYFNLKAYVAAANRASLVVRHYQGAPAIFQALVIMVKSYRALHLQQNEAEALAVLKYNYPGLAAL
ncbi:MAG: bamD 1 [Gammaproteobacteria bacterium]|jgi:outer membrane protein assembly factor BamD|nr:bamD 1 [Gammaproteobacteria bacterium]